ncbi:MAG: radical SAM protein [Rhodothermales bacterium]
METTSTQESECKPLLPGDLELIVSDHCNLTCRQCNHLSPMMAKWNLHPETAEKELLILSKYVRVQTLKIIGGEPLLNPNLSEIVKVAKASRLAEKIRLVTNGLLIDRITDETWEIIDEIELSIYPNTSLGDDTIEYIAKLAHKYDVKFSPCRYTYFRRTFFEERNNDERLVQEIFDTCKIANVWHCSALHRGKIYRCPQSIYIDKAFNLKKSEGFELQDRTDFSSSLMRYLQSKTPLEACTHCLGTVGVKEEHALPSRKEWSKELRGSVADSLDVNLLDELKKRPNHIDDCRTPIKRKSKTKQIFTKIINSI